jgi:hypothetical protein
LTIKTESSLSPNPNLTRAIVAAVQLPGVSDHELESSIHELRELALTLGYQVVGHFVQKRDSFDSAAYLGSGKRLEMRRYIEFGDTSGLAETSNIEMAQLARAPKSGAARAKEAAKSQVDEATRFADVLLVDHEI